MLYLKVLFIIFTCCYNDDGVFVAMNSVPRVLFDGWSAEDYTALFSSENEQDVCSRTLIQFLQVCLSRAVVSRTHTHTHRGVSGRHRRILSSLVLSVTI